MVENNNSKYFQRIADAAIYWNVSLHSIQVDYDCIHISTADGVGMSVQVGMPAARVPIIDVAASIDCLMQQASRKLLEQVVVGASLELDAMFEHIIGALECDNEGGRRLLLELILQQIQPIVLQTTNADVDSPFYKEVKSWKPQHPTLITWSASEQDN